MKDNGHNWAGELGSKYAHCQSCRYGRTVERESELCSGPAICKCGHHIDEHQKNSLPNECGTGKWRSPNPVQCNCQQFERPI